MKRGCAGVAPAMGFSGQIRDAGSYRFVSILSAKRGMDEFHAVAFADGSRPEILSRDKTTIDLDNDRGDVFSGAVKEVLHRDRAAFDLLGKTIENNLHRAHTDALSRR